MTLWIESAMVLLILTSLMLLGTSRLAECIRMVAIQGWTLGLLPILLRTQDWGPHLFIIVAGSTTLKGLVFPWLLKRAVREAHVRREVEPFVGYTLSLGVGMLSLLIALGLSARLPVLEAAPGTLVLPGAFFLILIGLFLLVSRKVAVSQVLGYLVLENGIYVAGVALVRNEPILVELGVLLDVFVAVFIMGIMIFHINREFDHIDVGRLTALKDSES